MKNDYKYVIDEAHAWLEVPKKELKVLGIERQVSTFSYEGGGMVYLEEDCDMGIFMRAFTKVNGRIANYKEKLVQGLSQIRKLPRYYCAENILVDCIEALEIAKEFIQSVHGHLDGDIAEKVVIALDNAKRSTA